MAKNLINVQIVSLKRDESPGKMKKTQGLFQTLSVIFS